MASLREIVATLGLDVDTEAFKEAEHHITTLKGAFMGVAGVLSGVVAGFAAATIEVAEHARHLYDASVAAGVGVETFQKLGFAAQESGADVEMMSQALVFLSRQANAAKEGNKEAAEHFAKAGVKVTDASGKLRDAGDIFREFADKSKNMTSATERTALSAELLGRNAGPRLQQLLAKGSEGIDEMGNELEELGGLMDDDFIQQSKEFTEAIGRMKTIGEGLGVVLARTFMPAMKGVIDAFVAWYKINKQIIASGIQHTVTAVVNTVQLLASVFSWGVDKVRDLFNAFGQFKGMAMLVAGALALLAAAFWLPYAPILILAALVALVFDDIEHYLKGQPSLIGDVVKAWQDLIEVDPTDSPMLGFLKDAAAAVGRLVEALVKGKSLFEVFGATTKSIGTDMAKEEVIKNFMERKRGEAKNRTPESPFADPGQLLSPMADYNPGMPHNQSTIAGSVTDLKLQQTVNITAAPGREKETGIQVVNALKAGSAELRAAHARFAPRVGAGK